jgi:GT2 family glycosyltransferase
VHDAGWKVFFLASASLVHLHKVSSEKLADKGVRYRLKSHYQYLLKHRGKIEASLLYVIILFASGARCLLEWVRGGNSRYYAEIVKWHLGLRRL